MRIEPCLLTLLCTVAAAADQPIVTLPASISDTTIPALSCVQPDLSDMSNVTTKEFKLIETQIKMFGDCMRQYIDDRHAKSSLYVNLQKAEVDAGNAATKALNAFFAQVRELQNKQHLQVPPKSAP